VLSEAANSNKFIIAEAKDGEGVQIFLRKA